MKNKKRIVFERLTVNEVSKLTGGMDEPTEEDCGTGAMSNESCYDPPKPRPAICTA